MPLNGNVMRGFQGSRGDGGGNTFWMEEGGDAHHALHHVSMRRGKTQCNATQREAKKRIKTSRDVIKQATMRGDKGRRVRAHISLLRMYLFDGRSPSPYILIE